MAKGIRDWGISTGAMHISLPLTLEKVLLPERMGKSRHQSKLSPAKDLTSKNIPPAWIGTWKKQEKANHKTPKKRSNTEESVSQTDHNAS